MNDRTADAIYRTWLVVAFLVHLVALIWLIWYAIHVFQKDFHRDRTEAVQGL